MANSYFVEIAGEKLEGAFLPPILNRVKTTAQDLYLSNVVWSLLDNRILTSAMLFQEYKTILNRMFFKDKDMDNIA